MDIKKSKNADLEQKRRTYFLLGIILVLMLLLTALEYTGNGRSTIGSEELPDDVNDDIELLPAMDAKDMMAAPTAQAEAGRKLKPVERPARPTTTDHKSRRSSRRPSTTTTTRCISESWKSFPSFREVSSPS